MNSCFYHIGLGNLASTTAGSVSRIKNLSIEHLLLNLGTRNKPQNWSYTKNVFEFLNKISTAL